jgi:hypothetical protein
LHTAPSSVPSYNFVSNQQNVPNEQAQEDNHLLDEPPAIPQPTSLSRNPNPPQVFLVGNDLVKVECEYEIQDEAVDDSSEVGTSTSFMQAQNDASQTTGSQQVEQTQPIATTTIRQIKTKISDEQRSTQQPSVPLTGRKEATSQRTTGSAPMKTIKQEKLSPKRKEQTLVRKVKLEPTTQVNFELCMVIC